MQKYYWINRLCKKDTDVQLPWIKNLYNIHTTNFIQAHTWTMEKTIPRVVHKYHPDQKSTMTARKERRNRIKKTQQIPHVLMKSYSKVEINQKWLFNPNTPKDSREKSLKEAFMVITQRDKWERSSYSTALKAWWWKEVKEAFDIHLFTHKRKGSPKKPNRDT